MLESIKHYIDITSIGIWLSAFFSLIPHIAALLSIVWVCFRIYESYLTIKRIKKEL